jgi:hypothetical protein
MEPGSVILKTILAPVGRGNLAMTKVSDVKVAP